MQGAVPSSETKEIEMSHTTGFEKIAAATSYVAAGVSKRQYDVAKVLSCNHWKMATGRWTRRQWKEHAVGRDWSGLA